MANLLDIVLSAIDKRSEKGMRAVAQQHGRRSFLAKSGMLFAGAMLAPVLPFDRSLGGAAMAAGSADVSPANSVADETDCAYWKHCALDGKLCSTSGGSLTACPPGSEVSKVAWVGTCRNPNDGKDYLVSYNDCCGRASVPSATFCLRSEGERPGYQMGLHNDANWCMANTDKGYLCTASVIVGLADA